MKHARRALAAVAAAGVALAYLGAGRSWQLRWGATGEELATALVVTEWQDPLRWAPFLLEPVQLISFLMTLRMLRGIKERAENSAPSTAPLKAGPRHDGPACQGRV